MPEETKVLFTPPAPIALLDPLLREEGCCTNHRRRGLCDLYTLMTLIPALIFSDIGPVLSLTGAVGGSCISYIGPGVSRCQRRGSVRLGDWAERWRRAKDTLRAMVLELQPMIKIFRLTEFASLGAVEANFSQILRR
eukprot:g12727.t1 g12727   contig67:2840-3250(+)